MTFKELHEQNLIKDGLVFLDSEIDYFNDRLQLSNKSFKKIKFKQQLHDILNK